MARFNGRFAQDDSFNGTKVRLDNDQALRARNNADDADIDVIKINASDEIVLASVPLVGSDAVLTEADKGVNNGVASLDASGRIPTAQLPTSATEYKGAWNASTDSPTLANGTGTNGDLYRVSVGGSHDFGAGSITFVAGDAVIYNGSVWEKIPGEDVIQSVNGQTGVVSLDSDDISEGSSNLYFTDARVRDAVLTGFVTGANSSIAATDSVLQAFEKTQGQIDAISSASTNAEKDVFTLTGTDITNGSVTLSQTPITDSLIVWLKGGPVQSITDDYTISGTTLTFAGDLAALAQSGDVLNVQYLY